VTGSATATPGPATFKLVDGMNMIRLDCPGADMGIQVAAVIIGGDDAVLSGSLVSCPSQPTGVKATGGPCQVSLDWSDSSGTVTGYKVYRATKSTGPYEEIGTSATSDYLDTGLPPSTTYYYKVSAYSGECESLQSTQAFGRTSASACVEAPTNLACTDKVGRVALSWTKVADATVQGYNMYRKAAGELNYTKINATLIPAADGTYVDTAVTALAEYSYQVKASYAAGESGGSNIVTVTVEELPQGGFRRGDADGSGKLDLTDAIATLQFLFMGGTAPACKDAADTDDSGKLDLTDAISSLQFQFMGGPPPASPGPTTCGPDPTADEYVECTYTTC